MSLYRLNADPLDFLFFDRPLQLRSTRLADGDPLFLHPKSNLRENAQCYEIEIELPGVDAKDIKVEVSKGHLSITAERREMSEGKEEEGAKKESRLSYKRLFRLPEAIDVKGIASTLKNGLLKIVLPKKEEEKPVIVPVAAKL